MQNGGRDETEIDYELVGRWKKWSSRLVIPKENLNFKINEDDVLNYVTYSLTAKILVEDLPRRLFSSKHEFSFLEPKNAWQMFKRDYLPLWFVHRFPVKVRRIPKISYKYYDVTKYVTFPEYSAYLGTPVRVAKINQMSWWEWKNHQ